MVIVHLIDALPYVFRAWYSLPETITDARNHPANATRGFGHFLLRYVREQRPTHLGVAFDESLTSSFRNDIYPDYKGNRELPPRELDRQLRDCRALAHGLGAATYADDRYEADDLIGTLAGRLAQRGHRVVVVSPDKDMAQLVGPRVVLHDIVRERRYDAAAVAATWGVRPARIPDLLGLAGDAVDNIPGVAGVGAKTAVALLTAFDDLEAIYARLDRVAELPLRGARGIAERLRKGKQLAFLSRELATIARDAPCRARLDLLRRKRLRRAPLDELCRRLAWPGLADRAAELR